MYIKRETVTVTADSQGDSTEYTANVVNGRILSIQYVEATSDSYADGVDFAITLEFTGQALWSESSVDDSKTVLPRQAATDLVGVAISYDTSFPVLEPIYVDNERVKIIIDEAGDSTTGKFHITIG